MLDPSKANPFDLDWEVEVRINCAHDVSLAPTQSVMTNCAHCTAK
ncbi:MAG: hypothetical protein WDW19_05835 [Neisseriaceae bacterium]